MVRAWRERALLTQEQLAERAGLGVRTVRRLESGSAHRPRAVSIRLLADALGLTERERTLLIAAADGGATANSPASVPRQLPADVAGFTGRFPYLRQLDALLDHGSRAAAVVISAIAGTAGIGKTALAVHWAHSAAGHFPDGQLYVDLHGYAHGVPTSPIQALSSLLHGLGVESRHVPPALETAAALYRSLLAGRRVLVVLDNARDAGQVRPLLPGSPTCLVVVTSRSRLSGLVTTHGARRLVLDVLSRGEARELLAGRLGAERVQAEPAAVDEIVDRCAGLPLALAIVAARAATHPRFPLAGVAAELRGVHGGLDTFAGDDPATDLRAVLSWSYDSLAGPAARLFRLLGLHAGPDVSAPAAASLACLPVERVRVSLAELAEAHLVTERTPGRFTMHDLLREHARELVLAVDSDGERRAALHRLLDHYLHTMHAADPLLDPHRDPLVVDAARAGVEPEKFADSAQALEWLAAERAVLVAAIRHAADTGFDTHAWQMAWIVSVFLDWRAHWHDQAAIQCIALEAARRLADGPAQARAYRGLGAACARLSRHDEAFAHYGSALRLYRELGDRAGQAHTHLMIAFVLELWTRYEEALHHAQEALGLYRTVGNRGRQGGALNAVGWYCTLLGQPRQAIAYCEESIAVHRDIGNRHAEASAWDSLGFAHHSLGDHRQAAICYQHALDLFRAFADPYNEADVLGHLGDTYHAGGDAPAARASWRASLDILDRLGHRDADRVRAKLGNETIAETGRGLSGGGG